MKKKSRQQPPEAVATPPSPAPKTRLVEWLTFAVAVLTLVVLGLNLLWFFRYVSIVNSQLTAMERATSLTQRAWISYLRAETIRWRGPRGFSAQIYFKNTGGGPAKEIRFRGHVAIEKAAANAARALPSNRDHPGIPGTPTLGAGVEHFVMLVPADVDDAAMADLRAGRTIAFASGSIDYRDQFDDAHQTQFCARFVPTIASDGKAGDAWFDCDGLTDSN